MTGERGTGDEDDDIKIILYQVLYKVFVASKT